METVQFSLSVVSDSLWPQESQHARPPCPSPTPGVHSDSRPSSQWCHPAISSSVVPFFSCPQSLPASECFPMSQLFTWGGQNTTVSTLASFLPKKSQVKGFGIIHFKESFHHKCVLNCVKTLFCKYWDDHMIFILQFVNMVYHIDWFVAIEESLTPRINPTWFKCMILLVYCWIRSACILWKIFVPIFISDIGL